MRPWGALGRLGPAVLLVMVALVLPAPPAGADAAGPTNDRSRIVSVRPEPSGAQLDVVGGDAFLRLRLEEGQEATVPGYGGEPYLRFAADGRVEVNRRSPATYLNADRETEGAVPVEASREAPPRWERVATGGEYAWHDHRIHWMGRGDVDRRVEWLVPMTIDGREIEVRGVLEPAKRAVPLVPLAIGAVVAVGLLLLARRTGPAWSVGVALAATALSSALAWSWWSIQPPGAGASSVALLMPLGGLLAAGCALLLQAAGRRTAAAIAVLAAVATGAGWLLQQLPAFWYAIVPGRVSSDVTRAGLGLLAGLVVAGAVLGVRAAVTAMASSRAALDERVASPSA